MEVGPIQSQVIVSLRQQGGIFCGYHFSPVAAKLWEGEGNPGIEETLFRHYILCGVFSQSLGGNAVCKTLSAWVRI